MVTEFQITCVFSIFCLLFAALGVYSIIVPKKRRERCTCETQAEVTKINELYRHLSNGGTRTVYIPTISFYANDVYYSNKNGVARSNSRYKVGDVVKIFYEPSNPSNSYIRDDYDDNNRAAYVMIVFGTVFPIIMLLQYFFNR